jgi:excisionase family DNA binding protein
MKLKDYPDVLTVKQLAQVLGIGRNTAYELLQNNEIKHRRIGTRYLIPKQCVIDFLRPASYNGNCNGGAVPVQERRSK